MKSQVIDQFKSIDNESKASLRKSGIKFGYKTIYDTTLLKPEASKLRIALFNAFYATIESKTFQPPPGLVTVEFDKHISKKQYLVAGFFVAGSRAIRIDMLERLYFLIKEHAKDEWIVVQPAMLSITGLGLENFAELIKSLNFEIKYEKVEKGDEVITLEKDNDYHKVLFKKHLLNKKARQIENSESMKNTRHQYKKKKTNNRIAKNDSPFSSLRALLKN
jgi:ATP-dependent RNA helicase SUPV3L1/SUV3